MLKREQLAAVLIPATLPGSTCGTATAMVHVGDQAQAGGGPLSNAIVTLWAGNSSDPGNWPRPKRVLMVASSSIAGKHWPRRYPLTNCPGRCPLCSDVQNDWQRGFEFEQ